MPGDRPPAKSVSPLGDILAGLHSFEQREVHTSPRTIINMAKKRAGSWRGAARELGVSESTLRDWRKGKRAISPGKRSGLDSWATQNRRGPSTRTVVNPVSDVRLPFEYNRRGKVLVGKGNLRLQEGTLEAVAKALEKGDSKKAAEAFVGGIGDAWYKARFGEYDMKELRKAAAAAGAGSAGGAAGGQQPTRTRGQGISGLPEGRQIVSGGSLRGDGTEAQGTMLEERQDELAALEMGGVAAMAGRGITPEGGVPDDGGTEPAPTYGEDDADDGGDLTPEEFDGLTPEEIEDALYDLMDEGVTEEEPEYETNIGP